MNRLSTSPRPSTPRGQRTRRRLFAAAETVFGRKGYERASIADITREAGVALGTFYVHFPDKKALFVEVVDGLGDRLRRALARAIARAPTRLEVERLGLEAFFAFAGEHRLLYRIVRQAEFVDEELFRRYYRRIAEPYARGLAAAMERGELRKADPEALAFCLMGMADFLGLRYVLWGRSRRVEGVLDSTMAFLREGLAPAAARSSRASAPRARSPRSPA